MSHVIFDFDGIELTAPSGARLLDILDDLGGTHGLPLACRGGNCGICRVRVLEGEYGLEQPAAAEVAQLAQLGAQVGERLGCQICVSAKASGTRVRIERVLVGSAKP
ncbi:MAG TPA: 2Fe-2S iron-sulfur cluster-binding protein [Polyangiales bacterium]|nr:2Fe-2S iron-sulfur cluster-binding protein [Polyangiales bacterium]